jgi:soluble lytic murein transglycosylase-like protein
MTTHTYKQMQDLVKKHNKSRQVSDHFVICLIWKETSFNDALKNKLSSATGLMQITKGAVEDVNKNTPKGVHFEHSEMTDPAKNIECGTYYLDLRIKWAKDVTKGVDGYGTGAGYSKNIFSCEACIKGGKSVAQSCLNLIHK